MYNLHFEPRPDEGKNIWRVVITKPNGKVYDHYLIKDGGQQAAVATVKELNASTTA